MPRRGNAASIGSISVTLYVVDLFQRPRILMSCLQGSNTYKLRNGPNGVAKRADKGEIDKICSHFNIQPSNPCVLLTQEHAKKFLHHGNEEDRYRFFLQAANMDSRRSDLRESKENIDLFAAR